MLLGFVGAGCGFLRVSRRPPSLMLSGCVVYQVIPSSRVWMLCSSLFVHSLR